MRSRRVLVAEKMSENQEKQKKRGRPVSVTGALIRMHGCPGKSGSLLCMCVQVAASGKHSDRSMHPRSLIRVFAMHCIDF